MATTKELCKSMMNYDTSLDSYIDSAILIANSDLRKILGDNEYILYINTGSTLTIDSITLDPDGDGSNLLELVISESDMHGMIKMTGFTGDYTFLNNKVASLQSGTNDNNETYKYIRFETPEGFSEEYVPAEDGGALSSLWYEEMQIAEAHLAIYNFLPMARRIAKDISIYVNASYGEATMVPTGIIEFNEYRENFRTTAMQKVKDYYITKISLDGSGNNYKTDWIQLKRDFSYVSLSR